MTWSIEPLIEAVGDVVRQGIEAHPDVEAFTYVGEPDEALPPSGPFCLVEYRGGPIELGNLEDWSHEFRLTAGVSRNANIAMERKAVRQYALAIIEVLRADIVLPDEAFLTGSAEVGVSGEMQYANVPFVGCSVTVRYQTTEGVAHLISD